MASAIVASTPSATTSPTVSAVSRSDESTLENPTVGDTPMGLPGDRRIDEIRDEKKDNNSPSHQEEQQQQPPERIQKSIYHSKIMEAYKDNNQLIARKKLGSGNAFGEGPLPRELRRIILEVAKTGKCSWLSWNHESIASKQQPKVTTSTAPKGNTLDTKPAAVSKPMATSSSSPSQYSPILANKTGGVVRKQTALGSAARRAVPPRKRHRNGVHKGGERMRFGNADGAFNRSNGSSNGRKRPLVLVPTNSSTASSIASAPSSVGSEPDYDSAPYECDSEGTSATSNSEISARFKAKRSGATNPQVINSGVETWTDNATVEDETNSVDGSIQLGGSPYKTLQTAFRGALGLVLDHFYQNRGNGYILSPAERRRNERIEEKVNKNTKGNNDAKRKLSFLLSSEYVFQQRRQRLMAMLLPKDGEESEEPPFTIQRIAEVLVAPDRYYSKTHKLCNCLERLLLVNSSIDSFGGSTGGDTSQRRREERELAALADEKGRQESKLRERKIALSKAPVDELVTEDPMDVFSVSRSNETANDESDFKKAGSSVGKSEKETLGSNHQSMPMAQRINMTANADPNTSREMLEALTRASLRSRFDPVAESDPQHKGQNATTERDITEHRKLAPSPPPSGLPVNSGSTTAPNAAVANHSGANGYGRNHLSEHQQQNEEHDMVGRYLEPTATNMSLLQYHHAVAMAGGVSLNRSNNPLSLDNYMALDASTISQIRSQTNFTGTGPGSESTDGRSSASNSDIDSESDDISFDDSASDRSDGSDSGSSHEPFTAARAMLLNRIQQQQRLQSRHQGDGLRPSADSDYQSGDSIDSTRAEDSCESDSSDMTA